MQVTDCWLSHKTVLSKLYFSAYPHQGLACSAAWTQATTAQLILQPDTAACMQIDVCCFDKTGTLTSDEMVLQGVLLPEGGEPAPKGSHAAQRVMAACQSLIQVEGKLVGDPLETTVFHACGEPHEPVSHRSLCRAVSACMQRSVSWRLATPSST